MLQGKDADMTKHGRPTQSVQIRWMIRRDMAEVLRIENSSFEFPWSEDDFIRCLRQRNCIGMIAECQEKVVGYMIYELHKSRLHIINFSVSSDLRRRGVGTQMISKLVNKLSHERRPRIILEVRETNYPAIKFFQRNGFLAVSLLRNFYQDTTEDAYMMQFECTENQFAQVNRISRMAG